MKPRSFAVLMLLATVFTAQHTAAQTVTRTYYTATWRKCEAAGSCYLVEVLQTDSGYYRRNYFVNNGSLQMAALYEDSACKTGNGTATYLYADGRLQRSVKMVHGKTEGLDVRYHNNGAMADSGTFHNGLPVGNVFRWHDNGFIADSIAPVNDSVSVHVSWFDDGTVAAAGRELKGKNQGVWVYYHHNGNQAAKELYENGKRVSVQHFDERGTETPVDTSRNERVAMLKGGTEAWRRYLERSLQWPTGYTFPNTNQVALQVEMTIAEDGSVQNVYVMNPVHPAFDKIAHDVISKSPVWMPAIQHNRPVKYRFRQSVTFMMD